MAEPTRKRREAEQVNPHNLQAEASLLGAAFLSFDAARILVQEVRPEDWYRPAHAVIASAVARLYDEKAAIDPVTVANTLNLSGDLELSGGAAYLIELMSNCPGTAGAAKYAQIIVDHAILRRAISCAHDTTEEARDLPEDVSGWIRNVRDRFANLDLPRSVSDPDPTIDEFLAQQVDYDWLIPGLVERGDRWIFSGAEGMGKSMWMRQLAVQFAAGIHPWRPERIDPISVLIIDLENSVVQTHRKLRKLREVAATYDRQPSLDRPNAEGFDAGNLRVRVHPAGLDLLTVRDQRWLRDRVRSNAPDLLILGPVYKLYRKLQGEEETATVCSVLDDIRTEAGCALMMEAHSPHGSDGKARDLRPIGSSVWLRWPEFGYGLAQAKDDPKNASELVAWRGARDEGRQWPRMVRRGGKWPWTNWAAKDDNEPF